MWHLKKKVWILFQSKDNSWRNIHQDDMKWNRIKNWYWKYKKTLQNIFIQSVVVFLFRQPFPSFRFKWSNKSNDLMWFIQNAYRKFHVYACLCVCAVFQNYCFEFSIWKFFHFIHSIIKLIVKYTYVWMTTICFFLYINLLNIIYVKKRVDKTRTFFYIYLLLISTTLLLMTVSVIRATTLMHSKFIVSLWIKNVLCKK